MMNKTSSNAQFETELTSRENVKRKTCDFKSGSELNKAKSSKKLLLREKSKSKAKLIQTAVTDRDRVDRGVMKR